MTFFKFICLLSFFGLMYYCKPTDQTMSDKKTSLGDTIRIANDELDYEIIIIDPTFSGWLASYARPRGFHNQNYLESRNRVWVIEYNQRVMRPFSFDPNLYPFIIDYQNNIDYGYEVNYMLFNYFVYFQTTFKQNLGGFSARP